MSDILKNKVAIIWTFYGPYHLARLREFSNVCPNVVAIEVASNQKKYGWYSDRQNLNFKMITLFKDNWEDLKHSVIHSKLKATLISEEIDTIVISGISSRSFFLTAKWAKSQGITVISFADSWKEDHKRIFFLQEIKKILYKKYVDAIMCSGSRTQHYYSELGFNIDRLWRLCDVVDNEFYSKHAKSAKSEIDHNRIKYNLPKKYFLFVGRFITKKNSLNLLNSFFQYKNEGGKWSLVMVGDGPDKQKAIEVTKNKNCNISFFPWMTFKELPIFYALASAFIIPSVSEPWGLVVNEAMACGLPVLVSQKCGCMFDLCWKGVNGFAFDPSNIDSMANSMLRISSLSDEQLEFMGKESQRIIKLFSLENWSRSLADCIDYLKAVNGK